jgi:anti-sigma regulatory factor (Ser/Thr protein kinase)
VAQTLIRRVRRECDRSWPVIDNSPGSTSLVELPCAVSSPAAARRVVRSCLGRHEQCDLIELLVSELVTNVVVHTDSGVELHLSQFDGYIRVGVSDRGGGTVQIRDADADGGRGLQLVEALAQRWGVDARHDGKTVWFELGASN